jgi:hypothetical protein
MTKLFGATARLKPRPFKSSKSCQDPEATFFDQVVDLMDEIKLANVAGSLYAN